MPTLAEIEAGKSEKGGYTKAQLAQWGVPWPPPKGWKEALVSGLTMKDAGLQNLEPSPIRPLMSAHELLRQVVLAVVERGHGSDLYDYPDVHAYFGARMPSEEELEEMRRFNAGKFPPDEPLVAQPEEQQISNLQVAGSSPAERSSPSPTEEEKGK